MKLETLWSLGKTGERKMTSVRKTEYWKEEKMEEEEKLTGRQRTLPPGLEGREEAAVTRIQGSKAIEEKIPRGRKEIEKRDRMVRERWLDNSKQCLKLPAQGRKGKELKKNLGPRRHKGPAKSSSLVIALLGSIAEDGLFIKLKSFAHINI